MKKSMSVVIAVAMSVMMFAGCGSTTTTTAESPATTPETVASATSEVASETVESTVEETTDASTASEGGLLASIKESGKLVVGTASGYPPYEFVDVTSANQDVIGIDLELAQAIADELGVTLEVQDMNFSSLLSSLPAHKIDIAIAGIAPTDERKQTMDFSDSYLFADQSIIVLKDDAATYSTLDAFKGQTVAVEKSTTQEAIAQELLTDSQVTSLEKVPDCILELMNGKAAGVVVESIVGEQYVISNDKLVFSDASFDRKKESAIALEKGNEDLLEIINKVIKDNQDNGNFDKWVTDYSEKAAANAQ